MEFKGTQGKWEVVQDDEHPTLHQIWSVGNCGGIFGTTYIARTSYAILSKENAQLIAHAPEMLEILIKLNAAIDAYNNNMTDDDLKAVNKIQKESHDLITRATTI